MIAELLKKFLNGHKNTQPDDKRKVEERLNEVERIITDIHDQRTVSRM